MWVDIVRVVNSLVVVGPLPWGKVSMALQVPSIMIRTFMKFHVLLARFRFD